MAIININTNLNGGDVETPDNELFYRIYGDVDNYASPIHTTGTAITDTDVTVDNDNVIITGVDGTTNTSFKISAVDGAGNEGILSDAVSSSIIVMQDDFAGAVIDTNKWTLTESSALGRITQNNSLVLNYDGPSGVPPRTNYLDADGTWDVSSIAMQWTNSNIVSGASNPQVIGQFWDGTQQNEITIACTVADSSLIRLLIRIGDTNVYDNEPGISANNTLKIVKVGDVASFWYLSAPDTWTQLGTNQDVTGFPTSGIKPSIQQNGGGVVDGGIVNVDDFYVSNEDYNTSVPT